eukprot:1502909-Rhodomonas_salina.3
MVLKPEREGASERGKVGGKRQRAGCGCGRESERGRETGREREETASIRSEVTAADWPVLVAG